MTLMILGLGLFIGIHLLPWSPPLREALVARAGFNGYRALFSLLAVAGLVLVVIGKSRAGFVPLWPVEPGMAHLARLLVLVGFIGLPAAHMQTNIKRLTAHPMLWGVVLWGVGHLLVNGDLASVVLFGSLVVYALAAMLSANLRGARPSTTAYPLRKDLAVVAAGVVAFLVIGFAHGTLFGVPVL